VIEWDQVKRDDGWAGVLRRPWLQLRHHLWAGLGWAPLSAEGDLGHGLWVRHRTPPGLRW